MPRFKNYSIRFIQITCICLLLAGCNLFSKSQKKLNQYCPGLVINLDSVKTRGYTQFDLSSRDLYILSYDLNDEKFIKNYFLNNSFGFYKKKDNAFFKKEDDDDFIDDNDDAVGKTIKSGKNYAVVIFNQTKQAIIILEYSK